MTSNLEDNLKNERQPQKWKTTSKMEDDQSEMEKVTSVTSVASVKNSQLV